MVLVVYLGCEKDKPTESGDQTEPRVEVVFPDPPEGNPLDISDSTLIIATAEDESGVEHIEILRRSENDTTAVLVERIETPDSTVNGVGYYSTNWRTGAIRNGSIVQVFASAADGFGNVGRSEEIIVRILNTEELGAPASCFLPIPAAGTIAETFSFDAGCTFDDIDPIQDLVVRWDFDGDGLWEIDTTEKKTPLDRVTFQYTSPRLYTVRMEAFNTYFDDGSLVVNQVEVTNVGGEPRPQSEMIRIPGGTYTIGAVDSSESDEDEQGVHTVTVSPYFIEKNEVTNVLYRTYLNKAVDSAAVIFTPPSAVTDTLGNRIIDFGESELLFDVEADSFIVRPGSEELPATGVNWFGATSYALFFGLRLPTEREWEIAARGDSTLWKYPWGREVDSTRCNFWESGDPFDNGPTPVGYYDGSLRDGYQTQSGESYFGINDMAGNVKEWVRDWHETPYNQSPLPNYQGPPIGVWKIVRGGSWFGGTRGARTTSREGTEPETESTLIGFRTAYTEFEEFH
jgi:formylglycine-generating enzyme required for sulfatase activity